MDREDLPCNLLKNPLTFNALIEGTNFEMNTDFDDGDIDTIYDEIFDSDGDDDAVIDRRIYNSPWSKPFSELRTLMVVLNENIYKRTIVFGNAEKGLMPSSSRVSIRYNAFWEGEGAPFDSSHLRGTTYSFYTGTGSVLEGIEEAVRTMYEGEEAQFLISYHLLFGEMGCPPRIKKKADGLYVIELVSFDPLGEADADQNLNKEDRTKYSVVIEKAQLLQQKGRDFFKQGMYKNAGRAFQKAIGLLNYCHLKDQEEERVSNDTLVTLYTNLAVCYNKTNVPGRTCIVCKEIRRLTNNRPSCKAVFQEGRALIMLGDYNQARAVLIRAQRMQPQSKLITKELMDLEARFKNYKNDEKTLWQKAMGVINEDKKESGTGMALELKKRIATLLDGFKKSDDKNEFELPEGLEEGEYKEIEEMAKVLGLQYEYSPGYDIHLIRKKF